MMEAGKEVCGETTGRRQKDRETWWWTERVQAAIKEKKKKFKIWQRTKNERDQQMFKESRSKAKREVAIAKRIAWERWYQQREGTKKQNDMYKLAKQMKRERKDLENSKYIRDENGNILVDERHIMERWKRYFQLLLNEENEYEVEELERMEGPVEEIKIEEVERAVGKMKNNKAPGPSGVTGELFKYAGQGALREMTRRLNEIVTQERIPEQWTGSLTVPIYKGKGDSMECGKYRGVRLLEQGLKVFETIVEERLRKCVVIDRCQFGFCKGRSTTEAIHTLRDMQEKYLEKGKELHHIFVD